MAYLIKAGHIPQNRSGVGARGYHVYRRGCHVHVVYGRIGTDQRRTVGFVWARTTQHKIHKCRTVGRAVAKRLQLVEEHLAEGYSRLPVGHRIHRAGGIADSIMP
jgi:hypothetical protein